MAPDMRALAAILAVAVVVGTSLWLFQRNGTPESLGGPEEPLLASSAPELEIPGAVPARSAASEPSLDLEPSLHGFVGRVVNVRDGQVSPAAARGARRVG